MSFIFIIIVKEIFNRMYVLIRMAKKKKKEFPQLPNYLVQLKRECKYLSYFLICYLLEGSAKSPDLGASLTTYWSLGTKRHLCWLNRDKPLNQVPTRQLGLG